MVRPDVPDDDLEDKHRFGAYILADVLCMMFHTKRKLNAVGRNDLIRSYNVSNFQKLHEEIALGAKLNGYDEYGSLADLLKTCTRNVTADDINGILDPAVIEKYDSYENALAATFEHCAELTKNSDRLLTMEKDKQPEFIKNLIKNQPGDF